MYLHSNYLFYLHAIPNSKYIKSVNESLFYFLSGHDGNGRNGCGRNDRGRDVCNDNFDPLVMDIMVVMDKMVVRAVVEVGIEAEVEVMKRS